MEHTNEFLMGMFAAYMGCEVMNTDDGKHLKMIGVSGYFISVYEPPYPFCESEGDEYEWMYSECKPILTPLSEITDVDAVEVIMLGVKLNKFEVLKVKRFNSYLVVDFRWESDIPELNLEDGFSYSASSFSFSTMELKVWQIDYLRSRHYDCGYMHIQSLIKNGLAITR